MSRLVVSVAALVLSAGGAYAQDRCMRPFAPTIPKGETATQEQIFAAREEVQSFIMASDRYQECLLLDLQQVREEARKRKKPVSESVLSSYQAKVLANQREKESVGSEFNAARQAFMGAHPGE